MPKIKLHRLALCLSLLFAVFSLGFYLGGRPKSGAYTIVTEHAPDGADIQDHTDTPVGADIQDYTDTPDGASTPADGTPDRTPAGHEKDIRININTASDEELTDLPGIGPVLAGRIVEYREAHGPFAAPEDLIHVSGIGEKKLADILPHVTV